MNERTSIGRRRGADRGVTLVEVIVVVGVVTVLLGLLLPALSGVTGSGRMVSEMSGARQLMVALHRYAGDHRDAVLPGYRTGLRARDERGVDIVDQVVPQAAARYPWRIAPYVDNVLEALYLGSSRRVLDELHQKGREDFVYFASLSPSLGMNATWVGGDESELGFNPTYTDRYGRFYVTSTAEVRRPQRLLVFASAHGVDPLAPDAGTTDGFFRVRSPWLARSSGDRWSEQYEENGDPGQFGNVALRHGGLAVAAFADSHVDTLDEVELRDMRLWANRANERTYGLSPTGR